MTHDHYARLVLSPAPHFSFRPRWEIASAEGGPWRAATKEEIEQFVPWVAARCSGFALRRGL